MATTIKSLGKSGGEVNIFFLLFLITTYVLEHI